MTANENHIKVCSAKAETTNSTSPFPISFPPTTAFCPSPFLCRTVKEYQQSSSKMKWTDEERAVIVSCQSEMHSTNLLMIMLWQLRYWLTEHPLTKTDLEKLHANLPSRSVNQIYVSIIGEDDDDEMIAEY